MSREKRTMSGEKRTMRSGTASLKEEANTAGERLLFEGDDELGLDTLYDIGKQTRRFRRDDGCTAGAPGIEPQPCNMAHGACTICYASFWGSQSHQFPGLLVSSVPVECGRGGSTTPRQAWAQKTLLCTTLHADKHACLGRS